MKPANHWFEPVAEHLGSAYLRYSFTKGTEQEVEFLARALGLEPGMTVLDVGCGPGRHALVLARRGMRVTGVDVSERFVAIGRQAATAAGVDERAQPPAGSAAFVRADARELRYDGEFDVAISLCQGAFGLAGGPGAASLDPDLAVLGGMARAVRPGGVVALSAFSAYFQLRYLESTDDFDAATGVNHEHTIVRSEDGADAQVELWTTCFTPRELRLACAAAGLAVRHLWSVAPGRYEAKPPDIDHPELLVIAERPR